MLQKTSHYWIGISLFLSLVLGYVLTSCQKDDLDIKKTATTEKEAEMVRNVKKYYDIVRAYNKNNVISREGIN